MSPVGQPPSLLRPACIRFPSSCLAVQLTLMLASDMPLCLFSLTGGAWKGTQQHIDWGKTDYSHCHHSQPQYSCKTHTSGW